MESLDSLFHSISLTRAQLLEPQIWESESQSCHCVTSGSDAPPTLSSVFSWGS